ncbi:MAG: hypothetical protein ACODTL_17825 [Brucella sp.]
MRGRKAGHRCALPLPAAPVAPRPEASRVLSDVDQNFPVGASELDAIESFLGPLIQRFLAGELPAADSEAPQIPATIPARIEGERHEVFAEDLA